MATACYRIDWTEFECGWGQRPDGYTLYLTRERASQHIDDHWAAYKIQYGNTVPDDYSAPSEPYLVECTEDIIKRIQWSETQYIWDWMLKKPLIEPYGDNI